MSRSVRSTAARRESNRLSAAASRQRVAMHMASLTSENAALRLALLAIDSQLSELRGRVETLASELAELRGGGSKMDSQSPLWCSEGALPPPYAGPLFPR